MTREREPHIYVEHRPQAAYTTALNAALSTASRWSLGRPQDAQTEAAFNALPVLRVTPHLDHDDCGLHSKHAAYWVRWSIPVPGQQNALPPTDLREDDAIGWYDLTPRQTLLASRVSNERESDLRTAAEDYKREHQEQCAREAAEADIEKMFSPQEIKFFGGVEGARKFLLRRLQGTRPASRPVRPDMYTDWDGLAAELEAVRAGKRPATKSVQYKLALAGVRRILTQWQAETVMQSIAALTDQAAEGGMPRSHAADLTTVTRQTLSAWERRKAAESRTPDA